MSSGPRGARKRVHADSRRWANESRSEEKHKQTIRCTWCLGALQHDDLICYDLRGFGPMSKVPTPQRDILRLPGSSLIVPWPCGRKAPSSSPGPVTCWPAASVRPGRLEFGCCCAKQPVDVHLCVCTCGAAQISRCRFHVQVLLWFQQPTFQTITTPQWMFSCTCNKSWCLLQARSWKVGCLFCC